MLNMGEEQCEKPGGLHKAMLRHVKRGLERENGGVMNKRNRKRCLMVFLQRIMLLTQSKSDPIIRQSLIKKNVFRPNLDFRVK